MIGIVTERFSATARILARAVALKKQGQGRVTVQQKAQMIVGSYNLHPLDCPCRFQR